MISEVLWAPLGAERDAELTVDAAGTGTIGGGFCATLRDYARLGALVAEGGRGIVPRDWIGALGAAPITDPTTVEHAEGYANQWWLRDGRVDCPRHPRAVHRRRPERDRGRDPLELARRGR